MQSSNERPRGAGGGRESTVGDRAARDRGPAETSASPAYDDPWYDALASGWAEPAGAAAPAPAVPPARAETGAEPRAAADVYLEVQRSAAFREVRGRYRRFVVPAVVAFFVWYVVYVVAATTAPGLMARPVTGAVNVAMVAGLGQFLTTFLLTWAYARHARLRRDRAALELRWDTQELARGVRGGAS
ncbi:DUF485 domain-containing protein [Streptomyces sp. TRM S81-3]|uniref:DUF485 domain-containing protein n=1 Tax=Streptomyces griseicoloratus TaxID=2752516 RepID=A0A926KZ53_9ACTN|nr:DUF485 domain-containing protein [Streptomyces griseicoloratus]MBD0418636.1 DUF485 domain-containing protein [Streptomyces griseicoloratus]